MSYAIAAENLEKSVGQAEQRLRILRQVNLQVVQGDSVAILGRSGAGKTTLLSLLAGLDVPTAGSISLAGSELSGMNEEQRARLRAGRVGFVFQSFQLLDGFSALENVRLSADLAGLDNSRERAAGALTQVELAERMQHKPAQLSGGEKQRVALARAFVSQPSILFADEPTGNLDSGTGKHIADLLFDLNQQHNTTLVLVTHDEGLAARCAQQYRLHDGELQAA